MCRRAILLEREESALLNLCSRKGFFVILCKSERLFNVRSKKERTSFLRDNGYDCCEREKNMIHFL